MGKGKPNQDLGERGKNKKRRLTCYLLQLIAEYLMSDETMIGQQSIKKERKKNGLEGEKVMMTYLVRLVRLVRLVQRAPPAQLVRLVRRAQRAPPSKVRLF
jgi:hypothetical protein